ncbi:hypothetical protein N3K66_008286 [Trichothecium roseum]|uniref:Uncharacterized protein n=1 Tax=Trichothecium roseum TaxID=47278 RepID=A0ACC0UUS0_9HYPO|nr:hypothetical protein N3K66_008286 [Trichothecium roseum]
MPLWRMLAPFGAMAGAAAVSAHRLAARNPRLGAGDRFSASWFALCGFLHCCFEGYFLLSRATLASSGGLFSQLWKEYALSDSRYLTGDVFTLCVEAITVTVWGPLSLAAAASVVLGSPRRHFLQVVVSTAHLYGVALYYATNEVAAAATATSYSRPEPLYYWVYYVGFNAPWAVVPLCGRGGITDAAV